MFLTIVYLNVDVVFSNSIHTILQKSEMNL